MSRSSTRILKALYLMIVLVVTVVFPASAFAQVVDIRVDGDDGLAVPVPPEGDTWGNAYKYLQDAIARAKLLLIADPDTPVLLWVAETDVTNPYRPDRDAANPDGTGLRTSTFLLDFDNVQVLGGFAGNETDVDDRDPLNIITVLSGDISELLPPAVCGDPGAGDCFRNNGTPGCDDETCCEAVCSLDPDCCDVAWDQGCVDLANDVCEHCGEPGSGDCFEDTGSPGCEDAICCALVCDVMSTCCEFEWDQFCADFALLVCSTSGKAYHVVSAIGVDTTVTIDGFTITDGVADASAPEPQGGGMILDHADLAIIRCRFVSNSAVDGGGFSSLADEMNQSFPLIINCEFRSNQASNVGGGALSNTIRTGWVNCIFADNTATLAGGGMFMSQGTSEELVNCTFVDNSSGGNGGGLYLLQPIGQTNISTTIRNSIFWGNQDSGGTDESAQIFMFGQELLTVEYSNVQGEWTGTGSNNIGEDPADDPLFVAPGSGDYRLTLGSPCIDVADPDDGVIPADIFDLDDDDDTLEATPDLDLHNRELDGDLMGGPRVDMGSYEFVHPDSCPWDLDNNGTVGATDLLILLVNWGPYAPCPPFKPADFDENCTVGATDLLALLVNWGPCPESSEEPPTLAEELADACLTQEDWDEFVDVMTDPLSSEEDKDRYNCWMIHYMFHCNNCSCPHLPECPSPDPFN